MRYGNIELKSLELSPGFHQLKIFDSVIPAIQVLHVLDFRDLISSLFRDMVQYLQ